MNTTRPDGEAIYIIGASGTGKSQFAFHWLMSSKRKRGLIWDFGGQWFSTFNNIGVDVEHVKGSARLIDRLMRDKSDGFICYEPDTFAKDKAREFNLFCGAAFLWNKQKPATIVVEEAATVLQSGQASGEWQTLQCQMRKYGGAIVCIIQRGQEGDKTTMSMAREIIVFRVGDRDSDYLMHNIGLSMTPTRDLEYIKRDKNGKEVIGKIDFNNTQDPRKYRMLEKALAEIQK